MEFPVRDRIAWELHRRLQDRSLLVAREWRRADLAVVRERIQLLKENSNNPELTGDERATPSLRRIPVERADNAR